MMSKDDWQHIFGWPFTLVSVIPNLCQIIQLKGLYGGSIGFSYFLQKPKVHDIL